MRNIHKPGTVLLHTKLNRPGVTKDLIVRPRLLQLLDAGLSRPLTLVVAPPGFGKTTLISSWAEGAPVPVAWLSLDERDGDSDLFLQYFIAALRTIFPDACPETLDLLNAHHQSPAGLIFDVLSNELELLPGRFALVLDDLHSPRGRDVFDYLSGWINHWPRPMHLLILSRYSPALPLAALRARSLLTEVRSRDLRFTPAETREYFLRALEAPLDETALSFLQQRLEGWPAGLKMATLSLGDQPDPRALTAALFDGDIYIADYLADEVFNSQPEGMQRFLLRAAIAEPFCASLCDALVDGPDQGGARAWLDQLEAADLFMTRLDNRREWYRFHHMFRDLLRRKLASLMTADQIRTLHRRAAEWFAARGLFDQAISHALEAGGLDSAVELMERGLADVLNREDRPTLERWLRLLPEDFIRHSSELLLMRGWDHALRWEQDQMAAAVDRAEASLNGSDDLARVGLLRGQIAAMKESAFFRFHEYERVVAYGWKALALLPEEWRYARGVAGVYLGMGLYAAGRAVEAERFLFGEYEAARDKTDGYALRLLLGLTVNFMQAGNYENAERTAQAMLRQAAQGQLAVMEGWGHYLLGFVYYEWNDLPAAARHFAEVVDLFHETQWVTARNGAIGQALTCQVMGRDADALEAIDQLSRIDLDYRGREGIDTAAARARLLLMQGELEGAERWADLDAVPLTDHDQSLLPWMEQPALSRARILIARNGAADARSAMEILDAMGGLAERTFNTRIRIEVLALRALAQLSQGDGAGARESLIRAVELGRRGLFTRVFVDLGPQMRRLLLQIAGHESVARSVGRILAAFPSVDAVPVNGSAAGNGAVNQLSFDEDGLDEHLTPRELEVLALMAEPISLKAIAARLNISYATARRYTINVYNKFDVHSRWEAVDSAVRKGIISPR